MEIFISTLDSNRKNGKILVLDLLSVEEKCFHPLASSELLKDTTVPKNYTLQSTLPDLENRRKNFNDVDFHSLANFQSFHFINLLKIKRGKLYINL